MDSYNPTARRESGPKGNVCGRNKSGTGENYEESFLCIWREQKKAEGRGAKWVGLDRPSCQDIYVILGPMQLKNEGSR